MGHANLSNISNFFVKRLYAKGKLSIKDCVEALIKTGEALHASEGDYDDPETLGLGCEQVVSYLLEYWENDGVRGRKSSPVIEASDMTDKQSKILSEWVRGELEGDDEYEYFEVLDEIQFKFCPGWRKRYKEIEHLSNVTN